MNEKQKSQGATKELDVRRLFSLLCRKAWLIGLTAVICAVLTFLVSFYFITPKYDASTMFYVNNSGGGLSIESITSSISSGDITSRQELVKSYIIILESGQTLRDVMDYANVNMTEEELRDMIKAEAVNNTEIFRVTVSSPDPEEAKRIADAVAVILPKRISTIINNTSAAIVDPAVIATEPSSPSYAGNTLLGLLVGLVLCVTVIVLRELFDVIIRSEEDIQLCCPHPVLSAVPDMTVQSKGGYYYREGNRRKIGVQPAKETVLVGGGISFAASEAYKLLRTKLQFSFVDDNDCHIIGVSSAMAGEGKSLSSVNLAYSLAQLDKRVLLIDCDMRRPSLSAKLPIKKLPGLSNYLTRQVGMDEIIQTYGNSDEEYAFNVIAAGRNPPNPIELLNSGRMRKALDQLRGTYDYIILDLPPVGEVSDALVVSKLVDGILLVVRQNYCNRNLLSTAVKQFTFVETRILGVVMNCATEEGGAYGKYYRGYRRSRYEGSYARQIREASKPTVGGERND